MATNQVVGENIELSGETFVLPPIPLVRMAGIKKLLSGGDFTEDPEYVGNLIDAIYWSLLRNYPELDRKTVEDGVDMVNIKELLDAFMLTNGLSTKADQPGEVKASQ